MGPLEAIGSGEGLTAFLVLGHTRGQAPADLVQGPSRSKHAVPHSQILQPSFCEKYISEFLKIFSIKKIAYLKGKTT